MLNLHTSNQNTSTVKWFHQLLYRDSLLRTFSKAPTFRIIFNYEGKKLHYRITASKIPAWEMSSIRTVTSRESTLQQSHVSREWELSTREVGLRRSDVSNVSQRRERDGISGDSFHLVCSLSPASSSPTPTWPARLVSTASAVLDDWSLEPL